MILNTGGQKLSFHAFAGFHPSNPTSSDLDDFAVLLPEWRAITPCTYNLLVGLRQQKYTYRAVDETF